VRAKDGDRVVALDDHREALKEEGALAFFVSHLRNAPSRSLRNCFPTLLMAPMVFTAIGTNKYDCVSGAYLAVFLSAAASATAPVV